jgi:type IV pilus biogenesis protein CpaD/CtpE
VNKFFLKPALLVLAIALASTLAGCGTPPAKDFGGSWKPVNHYQDHTTAIPLAQAYTFYASPMDGTLKTMLTRWSKDSGMVLSYQLTSDYTLYKPVAQIQTHDIRAAAADLNSIYAAEGVFITINDKQILVAVANVSKPDASETKPTQTTKPATPASIK